MTVTLYCTEKEFTVPKTGLAQNIKRINVEHLSLQKIKN